MLKLTVITITCRREARLMDMARTLLASLSRARDVALEWIVVDEVDRDCTDLLQLTAPWGDRFFFSRVAPMPSAHRLASPRDRAPAHNSARNAGLAAATGAYVIFLNDCTVVTADWVATAAEVARAGHGWRCRQIVLADMRVPVDKPLVVGVVPDKRWRTIPASTIGGSCWGAPVDAFARIHGFDLAYDGELYGHDLEAAIRLQRVGVTFVSTTRAVAIQLRRTATRDEVSTRKEVYGGTRNKNFIATLTREGHRTLPLQDACVDAAAPPAPAAALVAPGPAERAPDPDPPAVPDPVPVPVPVAAAAPAAAPTPKPGKRERREQRKRERAERSARPPEAAPAAADVPRAADRRDDARAPTFDVSDLNLDLDAIEPLDLDGVELDPDAIETVDDLLI